MNAVAPQPEAVPEDGQESVEVRPLIPTPERLSELLEMDIEEVRRMYRSATDRGLLVEKIMENQEVLRAYHDNIYWEEMEELIRVGSERMSDDPDISLTELENTLREVQQTLAAKREFLEETSPGEISEGRDEKVALLERVKESEAAAGTEKEKGLWRRVWDVVTYLPRKHPVITSILVIAAAAWGLSELFELLGEGHAIVAEEAEAVLAETGEAAEAATPVTELAEPGSAITDPGTGTVNPSGVTGYGDTQIPGANSPFSGEIPGTR